MKISIITPTWNRAATLDRTFRSIESQTLHPLEHIIVDNCSTDTTSDVVRNYTERAPYKVVHAREGDRGIYDAMNKGARLASGDALYFLNDDDRLLENDSLRLMAETLHTSGAGFMFADVIVNDGGTRRRRSHRQMNELTIAERSICQQATLYSTHAFRSVGEFDSSLRAAGDYDWIFRAMFRQRVGFAYLRHAVAEFFTGGVSNAAEHKAAFETEMAAVRRRYLTERDLLRSRRYRRFWRKIPWGLQLTPGATSLPAARPRCFSVVRGRLVTDALSLLGF